MLHQIKHFKRLLQKYKQEAATTNITPQNDYEYLSVLLTKEFSDNLSENIENISNILQNDRELYRMIAVVLADCAGQMIAHHASIVGDERQAEFLKQLFLTKFESTLTKGRKDVRSEKKS